MSGRVEGTLVLDGMIEGKMPADAKSAQALRQWPDFAAKVGLFFNFESDGGSFTMLAHNRALDARAMKPDPAEIICESLREMIKLFTPPERSGLFSTLRSVEYIKGQEVQTIYAVSIKGVETRQRNVEGPTTPGPEPVSNKEKIRMGVYSLAALVVLFGVSTFFVDYKKLFTTVKNQSASFKNDEVAVDIGPFTRYFTIDKQEVASDGQTLVLTLHRTADFPTSDAEADALTTRPTSQPTTSFSSRLALEAVTRGYILCESFDTDNNVQPSQIRIRGLREQETIKIEIPLRRDPRTKRIALSQ